MCLCSLGAWMRYSGVGGFTNARASMGATLTCTPTARNRQNLRIITLAEKLHVWKLHLRLIRANVATISRHRSSYGSISWNPLD